MCEPFFFLLIEDRKGRSCSQAFLAETVETGNNNRCVTEAMHVLRRKLRKDYCGVELFRNLSIHEFYCLKALITLEQVNTSMVEKKLINKTLMVRLTGLGVVNIHCMEMSLLVSMRFIFGCLAMM